LQISISFNIPNFDRKEIEIDCPLCKLGNWVQLGQIKRREYLVCRGCHSNIHLEDHLGGVQRVTKKLNNMFKDFI
jgi:transposase-like protein